MRKHGNSQEHNISVTWDAPAALKGALADYMATVTTTGASTSFADSFLASFDGLTPGTGYTITVTTRTRRNPGYGNLTVEHTTAGTIFYTSKWYSTL